jgi:hypothetical protein
MSLYKNITDRELTVLAPSCYESNGEDIKKTAHDLESIDLMLGVLKMRTMINNRDRSSKNSRTRGRGLRQILGQVLLRDK